jgi:predicted Zn-dependent protease
VNAFSIPGGNIYVNEGLIHFVESDDELAAVLAHEVSHAAFRHYATIQKDSALINALSLPLLVATILAKSDATYGAMVAANMAGQSFVSGWSVDAETAADYGAVQYLAKSAYQPVAVLSFMERLARRDVMTTRSDWTIYTTHPPSELRAHRVLSFLRKVGAPVKRSLVSSSLRARAEAKDDAAELWFGKTRLVTFRGPAAASRATEAVPRLNELLDQVPEMYQVTSSPDGTFLGKGKLLFQVGPDDAADHRQAVQATAAALRQAVFAAALNASFSGRAGA